VHEAIESFLSGFGEPLDDEVVPYFNSFMEYYNANIDMFENGKMTLEKRMYNDAIKVTGQVDCIIEYEGKTHVLDWKTSSKESISWRIQGSAYRSLCILDGYENVQNVSFIHLRKEKCPRIYQYDTYDEDYEIFIKCIDLYNFFNMKTTRKKR
jgi:hypothetical protein